MINNVPDELKKYEQWCISVPGDKAPKLSDGKGALYNASPVDGPWMSFLDACALAIKFDGVVGFVLTRDDPFVVIDLDVKDAESIDQRTGEFILPEKYTTPEEYDVFQRLLTNFDTYCELSTSRKGLHLWIKGNLSKGMKRGGVEVYPHERYIITTGMSASKIYFDYGSGICETEIVDSEIKPIEKRQSLLSLLTDEIQKEAHHAALVDLQEIEPIHTDEEILAIGLRAINKEKFSDLMKGDITKYRYGSQSEADFALMSIIAFYTKSNEQVRRIFRTSTLGSREKASANDRYLNFSLIRIRSREKHKLEFELIDTSKRREALRIKVENATPQDAVETSDLSFELSIRPVPPNKINKMHVFNPPAPPKQRVINSTAEVTPLTGSKNLNALDGRLEILENLKLIQTNLEELPWPPGLIGEVAQFIFNSAMRPVREVAIVASLGFFAGILGKAFNIPQSGLNLYVTLVALSGVGKEAMTKGIEYLLERLRTGFVGVDEFVTNAKIVSGNALLKELSSNHSFVHINNEWGKCLKKLSDDRDTQMGEYRSVLLQAFDKSSSTSNFAKMIYSDKKNKIEGAKGIAFSMIGDSTPETFYRSITPNMMEDGFLSRFLIIEYEGDRPNENENPITIPSTELCDQIYPILAQVALLNRTGKTELVNISPEAKAISKKFSLECDKRIRATRNNEFRQMWNRAHFKALRVAGLCAVAKNYIRPIIDVEDFEYGLLLVRNDNRIMTTRLKSGDIGTGDNTRELKVVSIIKQYVKKDSLSPGYKIPKKMHADGIVPHRYLQNRCLRLSVFNEHKSGANVAFNITMKALIDSGRLGDLASISIESMYGFNFGKCYKIMDID